MLQKLQSDVFVFSGMKTYTQLKEASLLLLDENKQIKPYHQFEQDILKIDNTYNRNYLQAEYQHATSAAQSASQWNDYMQDGNRYNLQIRTAGDDRVRESHAVLNGITLPAQHEFWKTHWTPFDWRCRCNIVQVLRDDYNESDIGIAHAAAQQAIPEMFRYNPGREGVIFPKKHPYYPQHCNGAKLNLTGLVGYATWLLDAENDRCKAMNMIKSMKEVSRANSLKTDTITVGKKSITYYPNLTDKKASDYKDVLTCCKHFTSTTTDKIILLPAVKRADLYEQIYKDIKGTIYEGKCPDFKVGKHYYELEGYDTKDPVNALKNMLNRGLKQSNKVIITKCGATERQFNRSIRSRLKAGQDISEVWELDGNKLTLRFKNTNTP